ncbi:hypothetical protein X777_12464 [Ooceraea biroi]|uniref:Uncharacterized protein n=1 Tax=Ooceraea biroi TaxID=2015173 RepID=A0A026W028_OOCBI|nr:hypothetical protein X777_12464 [Ooceraea biroi]
MEAQQRKTIGKRSIIVRDFQTECPHYQTVIAIDCRLRTTGTFQKLLKKPMQGVCEQFAQRNLRKMSCDALRIIPLPVPALLLMSLVYNIANYGMSYMSRFSILFITGRYSLLDPTTTLFVSQLYNGIVGDVLVGPYLIPAQLTAQAYHVHLQDVLPELLETVPLAIRVDMWFLMFHTKYTIISPPPLVISGSAEKGMAPDLTPIDFSYEAT